MLSALDLNERDYSVSRRYQRKPRVGDTDSEFRSRSQLAKASSYGEVVLTTKKELGEIRRDRARDQRYLQQGTDESKAYVAGQERKKHIEGRTKKIALNDTMLACTLCGFPNFVAAERRTIFCGRCAHVIHK
jgi:hypothetical protein